jgi:hypothetical protein
MSLRASGPQRKSPPEVFPKLNLCDPASPIELALAGDRQAVPEYYFTKKSLAAYLQVSIRSLDRAAALGLLPQPDLVIGRSPRWAPSTISMWLKSRPRLPGRSRTPRSS